MINAAETFTDEYPRPAGGSLHLADANVTNGATVARLDRATWDAAWALDDFIAQATLHRELWQSTRRLATLSDAHAQAAAELEVPLSILVLLEDWCGDAIHVVPVVQRVIEANPLLTLRVLRRDLHDDIMAAHLSGAARAIPVVIAYDADGVERGWWGPRPSPLQSWVNLEGREMEKELRYKAIRTWYARDRGATTATEVLQLLQHASRAKPGARS